MATQRELSAKIYRPVGARNVSTGNAWASGGRLNLVRAVDLSLPIQGLLVQFQGRCVIGGAAITTPNPEGYLNLISRIRITGTNRRQGGNVTLWDLDLPTSWVMQHIFERSAAYFDINPGTGATSRAVPTTPFPATGANGYIDPATGTYDFRIILKIPFYPFAAPKVVRPGFMVRQEEYKDSLQVQMEFGTVTNGAVAGALGTPNAATTFVFSSFGSGAGSPTVDVFALPMEMGLELKDSVLPGMLSRVTQPLTGVLQAAGNNINIMDLQKQRTTRIIMKTGTGTVPPHFATLSDTNVTSVGVSLGGKSMVRELLDVFTYKAQTQEEYGREPIQGYNVIDFIQSGNPDSAFPGDLIGEGSTFQLKANVAGVANAQGIIVQEQVLFPPDNQ